MTEHRSFDPDEPLNAALLAAARDLIHEYGWSIETDDGRSVEKSTEDCDMYRVLRKHLKPLFSRDLTSWRQARIEALKAELTALEGTETVLQ